MQIRILLLLVSLVVVPYDGAAMAKAVTMAHEAGIPVIAYDRIIRDSDLDLYVSFDNERVGELQAKFLVDHLPTAGKGRIGGAFDRSTATQERLLAAAMGRLGRTA